MDKDQLERLVAAAEFVQDKADAMANAEEEMNEASARLHVAQNEYAMAYLELRGVVLGDRTPPDAEEEAG